MKNNLPDVQEESSDGTFTIDKGFDIPLYSTICSKCLNIIYYRQCKAFDLIPLDIWNGDNPHTKNYEGDKGILFEKNPKAL